MNKELMVTRREALQGMVGVAAAAMLPGRPLLRKTMRSPGRRMPCRIRNACSRSITTGASTAAMLPVRMRKASTIRTGARWMFPTTGASKTFRRRRTKARQPSGVRDPTPLHTGPFDLYASEGQVSTGWTVGGMGWYRKTFDKPQVPPGGKAELRFEGVYMNCDVWLNGAHLGNHPYGYTEFAFDATPHLKDGKNTVAVRVNNTGRNSRWYSGSGIFRKVWLGVDRPSSHSRPRRLCHHSRSRERRGAGERRGYRRQQRGLRHARQCARPPAGCNRRNGRRSPGSRHCPCRRKRNRHLRGASRQSAPLVARRSAVVSRRSRY